MNRIPLLNDSSVGIICLTNDSLSSPWLHFEAGAILKTTGTARVCALLYDVRQVDVKPPLSLFQATVFEREDFRKLIRTINTNLKEDALEAASLNRVFEKWWPDLEACIATAMESRRQIENSTERSPEDMIKEILLIVRKIEKTPGDDEYQTLLSTQMLERISDLNTWMDMFLNESASDLVLNLLHQRAAALPYNSKDLWSRDPALMEKLKYNIRKVKDILNAKRHSGSS